jgi:hypothetical protein
MKTEALTLDIRRDIESGLDLLSMAVRWHGETTLENNLRTQAFMHAMQSGYTEIENGFKRILILFDEPIPEGANWHRTLLERILSGFQERPSFGDDRLENALEELCRFRHLAMHGYARMNLEFSTGTVNAAHYVIKFLPLALDEFFALIMKA